MKYVSPEIEYRLLAAQDVITASGGVTEGEGGEIEVGPAPGGGFGGF
jgi:hypothetical protein